MLKVNAIMGKVKTKEFILKGGYFSENTIDDIINEFLEKNGDVDIIDIKYTSGYFDSNEFYVRALLIYREPNPAIFSESEYNDEFF